MPPAPDPAAGSEGSATATGNGLFSRGASGAGEGVGALVGEQINTELPQLGHFARLPACSSAACNGLPHFSQMTLIDMATPLPIG
jgi:hypothetical protein